MSGGGGNRIVNRSTKGFAHADVEAFRQMGAGLSLGQNKLMSDPQQKKQTETTIRRSGSLFRGSTRETHTRGFMGRFSDINPEQMERLIGSLRRRQSLLQDVSRQPGRRFLTGA